MSKAVRDPLLPLTHYQRIGKKAPKGKTVSTAWIMIGLILVLLGAGGYFLHNEIEALKNEASTPTPLPTIPQELEPTEKPLPTKDAAQEGKFCGGIAATQCATGLVCQLEGNYPDAGGTCVKKGTSAPFAIPTIQIKPTEASTSTAPSGQACTEDAMQCPDGSWVGRSGPQCEFKCP